LRRYLLSLCALLWAAHASAQPTVAELEQCVARNLPEHSAVLEFGIQAEDREGGVQETAATLLWRRGEAGESRALLRIQEPAEMRGTAVLMILREGHDPRTYVYLPEVEKVRRIRKGRLKGGLLGTDFSYEDFERLQGGDRSKRTQLGVLAAPVQIDGRSTWALEAIPDPDERSAYRRVVTYIDPQTCLPLQMDFEDKQGQLRKRLSTDINAIRRDGERFVPASYLMQDLRDGTQTQLIVRHLDVAPHLAAEQLSKEALRPAGAAGAAEEAGATGAAGGL